MTPKQTLEQVGEVIEAANTIEVSTFSRSAQQSHFHEVRALSLATDAEGFFESVAKKRVLDRITGKTWKLRAFSPVYKTDKEDLEWLRVDDVPAVKNAVERAGQLSSAQPFDPADDGYKKRLRFWAMDMNVVDPSSSDLARVTFFRAFSASSELTRKSGAALVLRGGAFTKVEDAVFIFDEQVDCFVAGGYVFVNRKANYRRIFDQTQAIFRRAKRAARAFVNQVPVSNAQDFIDACASDSRLADKVLSAQSRDYFSTLTYEKLQPVIDEFGLGIPSKDVEDTPHLVFQSAPAERFRILKLIDDDYLRSSMTDERYEVNSKTEPPASG